MEASVIVIDANLPAGNVVVDELHNSHVRLRPDLRDTPVDWFYWHFRVSGAAGRTLHFSFTGEVIGVRGPAVSLDRGWTWQWLGAGSPSAFSYTFPEQAEEVRFSFGMPYTQRNLDAFLAPRLGNPHLRVKTLCRSRHGRRVELLTVGSEQARHRVLLTARHHCCEMMASYALEGLLAAALAEDEGGEWLREHVQFLVVPFVDKDGVEEGDQGKSRAPHDHNRDYAEGLYPEVAALRTLAQATERLRCAIDLHCPWIRGVHNEEIYFVGVPEPQAWAGAEELASVLERVRVGPLPYHTRDNLLFGVDWNVDDDLPGAEPTMFARWMGRVPGLCFGTTIEIPYANVHGAEVNPDSARAFGRDLAAAMWYYLRG